MAEKPCPYPIPRNRHPLKRRTRVYYTREGRVMHWPSRTPYANTDMGYPDRETVNRHSVEYVREQTRVSPGCAKTEKLARRLQRMFERYKDRV